MEAPPAAATAAPGANGAPAGPVPAGADATLPVPPAGTAPYSPYLAQALCEVAYDRVSAFQTLFPRDQCKDVSISVVASILIAVSTSAIGLLWLFLRLLPLLRPAKTAPQQPRTGTPRARSPLAWLRVRLFGRRWERRYLRRLAERNGALTVLGRAVPLHLSNIYVGLKVAARQAPGVRLESPAPDQVDLLAASGRTLSLPEALGLRPRRLLILGEPGAGKSTLTRFLVLAMARRDRDFAPFARALGGNRTARALEWLRRRLNGIDLKAPSLIVGALTVLVWVFGAFLSGAAILHLLGALAFGVGGFLAFAGTRRLRRLGFGLTAAVLAYVWCGTMPVWCGTTPVWAPAAWATTVTAAGLAFPFLIVVPVRLLGWLVRRRTRYPLPVLLTLNNDTGKGGPLEAQAAATIAAIGGLAPDLAERLLRRRLAAGTCLLLLDGLDEVTDPLARARVIADIAGLREAHEGRNQVLVTCRTEAYGDEFGGWVTLAVQRFETAQVRTFVRQWFAAAADGGDYTDRLLAALARKPGLQALAATPLLLALIVRVYEDGGQLPASRVALYRRTLGLLTEDWNKDQQLRGRPRLQRHAGEVYRQVARVLAAEAHAAGLRVIEETPLLELLAAALTESKVPGPAEDFLKDLMADTGLLRQVSANGYDFAHLTLQEYLTAEAVADPGGADALLGRAGAAWWREVIRFYAGLTRDPAALIGRLLGSDPLLAAGCLADARLPAGDPAAVPVVAVLADWLGTERDPGLDPDRRQAAADALAEIGGHGAREALEQAVAGFEQNPEAGLAALLALAPGNEAGLRGLAGGLGALLRRLHTGLPDATATQRGRILALLETLGHPLCLVPAGTFRMGSESGGQSDERPAHEVRLAEYWIDRHPVTNRQFAEYAQEAGVGGGAWRTCAVEGREDHPVVAIDWAEAAAYGAWCGKRLPSEAEWEKAARGTDGRRYPWGNRWDAERCNTRGRGTSVVFEHPEGASPYGCQDMAGNVYEWCQDWYQADWYRVSPSENPIGPESGVARVVRSGSWGGSPAGARAADRSHGPPRNRNGHLGCRLLCGRPIR